VADNRASALVRAIAQDRWPGAPMFVVNAERTGPEAEIEKGARVVYVQAPPRLNDAVVWLSKDGAVHFGRIKKGGQVLESGKLQTPAKHKGVVVAVIAAI
jgi:hypothetical protein